MYYSTLKESDETSVAQWIYAKPIEKNPNGFLSIPATDS